MKKTIATFTLAAIMTFGTTFANAGLLVSDFAGGTTQPDPCKETVKVDSGIIITDIVGIIITDLIGIIITDAVDVPVNCGIIITD